MTIFVLLDIFERISFENEYTDFVISIGLGTSKDVSNQ